MNINNFGGTINYNDHHKEFTISGASTNVSEIVRSFFSEDITPYPSSVTSEFDSDITPCPSSVTSELDSDIPDSIIFTKKARQEGKIPAIIHALQKSIIGRKDKTRALVQELQSWQNDGYVDAHYNARVMYDELDKLMPLSFGYEVFKKYYNNTI